MEVNQSLRLLIERASFLLFDPRDFSQLGKKRLKTVQSLSPGVLHERQAIDVCPRPLGPGRASTVGRRADIYTHRVDLKANARWHGGLSRSPPGLKSRTRWPKEMRWWPAGPWKCLPPGAKEPRAEMRGQVPVLLASPNGSADLPSDRRRGHNARHRDRRGAPHVEGDRLVPADNGPPTKQFGPDAYPGCNGPNLVFL